MTDVPKPAIGPNDVLIEVQKNLGFHYPEGAGSLLSDSRQTVKGVALALVICFNEGMPHGTV